MRKLILRDLWKGRVNEDGGTSHRVEVLNIEGKGFKEVAYCNLFSTIWDIYGNSFCRVEDEIRKLILTANLRNTIVLEVFPDKLRLKLTRKVLLLRKRNACIGFKVLWVAIFTFRLRIENL